MRKLAAASILAVAAGCSTTGGNWREFEMDPALKRYFAQNVRIIYLRIMTNPSSSEIAKKWPEVQEYHEDALRAARLHLQEKGYDVQVRWDKVLDYSWREKTYPVVQKVVLKDDRFLSDSSALIELYAGDGGSRRAPTRFCCLSVFYLNPDFRAAHRWTETDGNADWDYVMRRSLAEIPPHQKEVTERSTVPPHKQRKPSSMLVCTDYLKALRSELDDYTFSNIVCTSVWHHIKVERAGTEAGKILVFLDEPRRYEYEVKPWAHEREHEGAKVREETSIGDRNFVFYKREMLRVGSNNGEVFVLVELHKKNASEDVIERAARRMAEVALFHLESLATK